MAQNEPKQTQNGNDLENGVGIMNLSARTECLRTFHEIEIPVPWGHISGKWWGSRTKQPVLALHGWQDNAGTFDRLIPLLPPSIPILAIDLPGHGHSSHHPKGHIYNFLFDYPLVIRRLVKHFNWKPITILGHSLGGVIGFLYAATFSYEVEKLIQIDIAGPPIRDTFAFLENFEKALDRFLKFENLKDENAPCYEYKEMIDLVVDAHKGSITRESCEILMKRGMKPTGAGDKFRFTRDVRLKVATFGLTSIEQSLEMASQVRCKCLNIRALSGWPFEHPEYYTMILDRIKEKADMESHSLPGTHHFHLNNPEIMSEIISRFLVS